MKMQRDVCGHSVIARAVEAPHAPRFELALSCHSPQSAHHALFHPEACSDRVIELWVLSAPKNQVGMLHSASGIFIGKDADVFNFHKQVPRYDNMAGLVVGGCRSSRFR